MKSLCQITVSAHDGHLTLGLQELTLGERVVVFGGYITKIVDVYCSACSSFSVEFGSGRYMCELKLAGWDTGQCTKFTRR